MAITNVNTKLTSGKDRVYRLFHCTPQSDSFSSSHHHYCKKKKMRDRDNGGKTRNAERKENMKT